MIEPISLRIGEISRKDRQRCDPEIQSFQKNRGRLVGDAGSKAEDSSEPQINKGKIGVFNYGFTDCTD